MTNTKLAANAKLGTFPVAGLLWICALFARDYVQHNLENMQRKHNGCKRLRPGMN